jgi:2-methylcitrate dehydratase PrpD
MNSVNTANVMSKVEAMNISSELVRNVVQTSFDVFDTHVVDRAKDRIIDVVGCSIGGANAPGCSMVIDLMREYGGNKESTILAHGGKIPAHNAAMVNSVMARSYDFEACNPFVDGNVHSGHISGTTVPTVIAVAEQKAASGKDVLTALILGDDLASRMHAASNFTLDTGWDCTGTINMFGATAIAGKIWGLDENQMLNAFGIVLNQLAGTMQNIFDSVHTFKLPQGLAARAGIFSAGLARKGFTGVKDPFFSKYGYFSLYCRTCQPEILTKDLGKKFYGDITLKPYPSCRLVHGAVDCALDLVHANEIIPGEIDEVIVDISPTAHDFAVGQLFEIGEVPQVSAAFSFHYTVASALLRKTLQLEHFTEESIKDRRIMDLVKKIRLNVSIPPETRHAAGVRVKTKQGKEFEKRVDIPKGLDTVTPLTPADKKEKFMNNVAFSKTVPLGKAEKVLSMLERLEEIDNLAKIVKLLVT